MRVTKQHRKLVEALKQIILPWRKLTIAVDGVDGVGKSSLARFLSWQLGMPTIETDLVIQTASNGFTYDFSVLSKLISARHDRDRPVIIEGMCVLETMDLLGVQSDYLVYVEVQSYRGSITWNERFESYDRKYHPRQHADFIFRRRMPRTS
jgi:hypothetical protein